MKYTKQQLTLIIDKIYDEISKPIILENEQIIDAIELEETPVIKDKKEINEIDHVIKTLQKRRNDISNKYKYDSLEYKYIFNVNNKYILDKKKEQVILKTYPSKQDIEYELLINSNSDIQTIVDKLIEKYRNV
jgi:hypothetical protein